MNNFKPISLPPTPSWKLKFIIKNFNYLISIYKELDSWEQNFIYSISLKSVEQLRLLTVKQFNKLNEIKDNHYNYERWKLLQSTQKILKS